MKIRDQRLIILILGLGLILIGLFLWKSSRNWTKPLKLEVRETLNKADERKGTDWYLRLRITNITGSGFDVRPADFKLIDDSGKKYSGTNLKRIPGPPLLAHLGSDKKLEGWLTFHLPFGPRPVRLIYRCSLNDKNYLYDIYS